MPYFFRAFRQTLLFVEVIRSQNPLARRDRPAVPRAAAVCPVAESGFTLTCGLLSVPTSLT